MAKEAFRLVTDEEGNTVLVPVSFDELSTVSNKQVKPKSETPKKKDPVDVAIGWEMPKRPPAPIMGEAARGMAAGAHNAVGVPAPRQPTPFTDVRRGVSEDLIRRNPSDSYQSDILSEADLAYQDYLRAKAMGVEDRFAEERNKALSAGIRVR